MGTGLFIVDRRCEKGGRALDNWIKCKFTRMEMGSTGCKGIMI